MVNAQIDLPITDIDIAPQPLSFAQRRLWFLSQLEREADARSIPAGCLLDGPLDIEAFDRAFAEVVRRHDVLRARFVTIDGEPRQIVDDAAAPALMWDDVSDASPEGRLAIVQARWQADASRPFDLAQDPLVRARVIRLDADRHAVTLVVHHIVCDGWSLGIFWGELSALYQAFARGEASPLPPLAIQYAQLAARQQETLRDDRVDAHLAFWRRELADAPAVIDLPYDRPRASTAFNGAAEIARFQLSAGVAAATRQLARRTRSTPHMVLLSAFQALLSRYSRHEEIVVGTLVAGRTEPEAERLIGMFVNTLPLRASFADDPTFESLLRQTRTRTLGSYTHQALPFERLVEGLGLAGTLSHHPIVQALFTLQNAPTGNARMEGLRVSPLPFDSSDSSSTFDLVFSVFEQEQGLDGVVTFRTDLFDRATIELLTARYARMVETMLSQPQMRVSEAPLLSDDERDTVLASSVNRVDLAALAPAAAGAAAVHQLFEARVRVTPDALALRDDEVAWSYAELNARANRLAHWLTARGAGPEVRIGLCLARSPEMVLTLLAIWKAGATAVPMEPTYPSDRLALMAADSQIAFVVATAATIAAWPAASSAVCFDIADGLAQSASEEDANPDVALAAGNSAYIIYTSGSSGRPKGVVVSHGALVNKTITLAAQLEVSPETRYAAITAIGFDPLLEQVACPLYAGAAIIVVSDAVRDDPAVFAAYAARHGISVLNATPALIERLCAPPADGATATLPRVDVLIVGGDVFAPKLANDLLARSVARRVMNFYGPTEACIDAASYELRGPQQGQVPIGGPMANYDLFVLDSALAPVPAGACGEICIGGDGLARGYAGLPGLTADRFVPNPYSTRGGERLYRTGDRARRRHDGAIEFLGRRDGQMKVRGHRIEAGEIELALRDVTGAHAATVIARRLDRDELSLVAYLVADERQPRLGTSELRRALQGRLPSFMVPSVFVYLDALPLTPSGKVDRQALPAPTVTERSGGGVRTVTEAVIAEIWAGVLGVTGGVGADDDFFELGGHSLLATRVVSRLRAAFGVDLPVRAVFEASTVAQLAARVDAARPAAAMEPLRAYPREGAQPLSFAQERLWFLQRLEPESVAFHVPLALRLRGALDVDALRASLTALAARHEPLRTVIQDTPAGPVQLIHDAAPIDLPVEAWPAAARTDRAANGAANDAARETASDAVSGAAHVAANGAAIEQAGAAAYQPADEASLLAETAAMPFDLAAGPLWRARLLQRGDAEHLLLLVFHHIVVDAWSMGVLHQELSALYAEASGGAPANLAPLPVQYADVARWQRATLTGDRLAERVAFWRTQLAGAPPSLELPTDRPRPVVAARRGAQVRFDLPPAVAAGLRALSRREGTTLFMTLLAAFQALLGRYAGQSDVVVGTSIAGRVPVETEGLVGMFFNLLPLRASMSPEMPFRTLLAQVRETLLAAYAHQDLPFDRLVSELGVPRSVSHHPIFQVLVELQNTPRGQLALDGLAVESVSVPTETAKFDLTLSMAETPTSLAGALNYDTELFDASTMARMAGHFETLLAGIVAAPAAALSDLPWLTAAERTDLVDVWNATGTDWPETTGAALFDEQAARTPHAEAVRAGDASLTYAELQARAHQLAHYLQACGVGPGSRVGLCVPRGLDLAVALLGIWKAGAAYIGLDPTYPAERRAYMLSDAQAALVVTHTSVGGDASGAAADGSGRDGNESIAAARAIPTVCLDRAAEAEAIAEMPTTAPTFGATPNGLAYVYYTSGSTGRPKGVAVPHAGVANYLRWGVDAYGAAAGNGAVVHSSMGVDLTVTSFLPLMAGGRIVMAPEAAGLDGLVPLLRDRPDWGLLKVTPTHLALLNAELPAADLAGTTRVLVIGADQLVADPVSLWRDAAPGIPLINEYGPTETVVGCSIYTLPPDGPRYGPVPIGRPIANLTMYIHDAAGELVPRGVPGELVIGGAGVAWGYWGRTALTADKFQPDPYSPLPGARLYRTGDRARLRGDGELEFLGRFDHQVKLRGYRIELGEIEGQLTRHAAVQQALVLLRAPAGGGEAQLVAYVAVPDGGVTSAELRQHLKTALPDYMIPTAFVLMEALPVAASGKIRREDLPAPELDRPQAAADGAPALRTITEEVLAGIWADVLQVSDVGPDEDFFELGGHSLLAMRIISRMRETFRVDVAVGTMFASPTVRELAAHIDAMTQAGLDEPEAPAAPVDPSAPRPLSFAQQRLLFLHHLEPDGANYNMPFALRLRGALQADALTRALQEIVRRHHVLQTTFALEDGQPLQTIGGAEPADLPITDLTLTPSAQRDDRLREILRDQSTRPFDLARSPLRMRLVRLGDADHVLSITMHHIVSDGWSMEIFARELTALYEAFTNDRPSPLPSLPSQYADHAAWQHQALQGDRLDHHLAYWKAQLADVSDVLDLPTTYPRPAAPTHRGANYCFDLPDDLVDLVRAASRRYDVTLFMTFLTAYGTLLHRYTGQDRIVIGTPIAGRRRPDVERLIGCFLNTLPLQLTFTGRPTFGDLLRQTRAVALGAYGHEDLPFERLVEELQPTRRLGRTPIFQTMLVFQNVPPLRWSLGGLEATSEPIGAGDAKLDLMAFFTESEGRLKGAFEYSTELFDEATIRRMAEHLQQLLREGLSRPDEAIRALAVADAVERGRLSAAWNDTARDYPLDASIPELFARQVARTPDQIAVRDDAGEITYRDLDARAAGIARALQARGVTLEEPIGVCLERSITAAAAALGVLKAGCVYVPLNPRYPSNRLSFIMQDAALRIVLTTGALADRVPPSDAIEIVHLESIPAVSPDAGARDAAASEATALEAAEEMPRAPLTGSHAAYVIYTSGSTGRPKGVLATHRGLVNRLHWAWEHYPYDSRDVCCAKTSLSLVDSMAELFGPLLQGVPLIMLSNETRRDMRQFIEALKTHRISRLVVVPALLRELLRATVERGVTLPDLRLLVTSGEELVPELADASARALPQVTLINLYGATEIAADVTVAEVRGAEGRERVSIGRPLSNTRTYVLDDAMELSPTEVPGELYVAGASLARGYLGRPAITAERFVPDPFSTRGGERLYRTGDRARWRADGVLEYQGRRDAQVKIRGYRVETGEIEAVLSTHPQVDAAVVVAIDAGSDRRLVAHVVPMPGAASTIVNDVRAYLKAHLPDHMVPSFFMVSEALPIGPSGKVDRRALPAPTLTGGAGGGARTVTEAVIAEIWAGVLGVSGSVGVDEGFFELGGHSLLATRVVARVRAAFGIELPVRAVFEAPTVAQLAARVDAARPTAADDVPLRAVPREGPQPLSFAQERLWFLQQLEPESVAFHVPLALRLRGALDIDALRVSLTALVARHEPLRTTIHGTADEPVQLIHDPAPVALAVEPWPDAAIETGDEGDAAMLGALAAVPFDLAAGPLWRARLLQRSGEEHLLLLVFHHIVVDAWSLGLLFGELSALYTATVTGTPAALAPLPVQYADVARWQRATLTGDRLAERIAFWRTQLAGAPPVLELPTDRPRPVAASHQGAQVRFVLSPDVTAGLRALSRREGTTLFMTLLASFQSLLGRYAGQSDVVVGTSIAGRVPVETESLVGMFFNLLPVRAAVAPETPFRAVLAQVRETLLAAYAHQDLPFDRLVGELGVPRSLSHHPVFQVLVEMQNTPKGQLALAGLTAEPVRVSNRTAKFDLTLSMAETPTNVLAVLDYDTELFDEPTIARMVGHFETMLAGIVATPAAALGDLPWLTAAERTDLVDVWNATGTDWPATTGAALFDEQVARTPHAEAVRAGDASLTYAQLQARAHQLAHYLQACGVGPGSRVGLCVPRSLDLAVALLGIWKAGAAYIGLDPTYPAERRAYMLEDAEAALLLTHARGAEVGDSTIPTIPLDREAETIAAMPETPPACGATPDGLAYIYYTSGSTGRPKGVAVPHAGVANYLRWGVDAYGAAAGNGAVVHSSMGVDLTVTSFLPLMTGGRIVMAPEAPGLDGLVPLLRDRPDWGLLKVTPTHLALLNAELPAEDLAGTTRVLVIGADQLVADPVSVWRDAAPGIPLINEYGPTETVVGCSIYTLPPDGPRYGPVPIGRPIANLTMYIHDAAGELVPRGVPGELVIGGAGVAWGYWGRAALTADKFQPDPYSPLPGARLYRTGDRARLRGDGELEFLGRFDHQVKLRGYRIELGEIEGQLTRHPAVQQALVLLRAAAGGGEAQLVAYVAVPDGGVTASDLRQHLRTALPDYMIPTAFVLMEALPVAASGKIRREDLPAPEGERSADLASCEPPRDPLELQLVQLWEEVLGTAPIGTLDNFFDLGGHSMLAIRLVRAVRARFGRELPLSTLIGEGTIRGVADVLRAQEAASQDTAAQDAGALVAIQPSGTQPPLFCVHPAGGGVYCYIGLARHLGADQPVYGLQDPLFPRGEMSDLPIEALARTYIDALRAVQPAGPYHLAGWSFGGVVAFEMACQLRAAGEEVARLAILDTPSPVMSRGYADDEEGHCKILAALVRERASMLGRPLALSAEDLLRRAPDDRAQHVRGCLIALGELTEASGTDAVARILDRWWVRMRRIQRYEPRPFDGEVTLFRSTATDPELDREWPELAAAIHREPTQGWERLSARPVRVHDVPGTHATIGSEPHVQILAGHLKRSIA